MEGRGEIAWGLDTGSGSAGSDPDPKSNQEPCGVLSKGMADWVCI